MASNTWSTLGEIFAAPDRFTSAIPGWADPAAYGVGVLTPGGSSLADFPVVNIGAHRIEFDDAIARLTPAEACTDEQYPL